MLFIGCGRLKKQTSEGGFNCGGVNGRLREQDLFYFENGDRDPCQSARQGVALTRRGRRSLQRLSRLRLGVTRLESRVFSPARKSNTQKRRVT